MSMEKFEIMQIESTKMMGMMSGTKLALFCDDLKYN